MSTSVHGGSIAAIAGSVMMIAAAAVGVAQDREADRLARAHSLSCEFSAVATVEWSVQTGIPSPQTRSVKLAIKFEKMNFDDGTAEIVGAGGTFDITVRMTHAGLHLMQSFRDGPLYVTSVFPSQTPDGKFKAAHVRHEFTPVSIPGYTSRPEQYYGACDPRP